MYSRKTGPMYNSSQAQQKIESFNNNLKEQYHRHNSQIQISNKAQSTSAKPIDKPSKAVTNEDLIIIGLIVLLLLEENKDYLIIGVLASLLLLSR